ncbi:MAG: hypothetical protein ABI140_03075, partial [Jatrophihabitantaceae bacterium]
MVLDVNRSRVVNQTVCQLWPRSSKRWPDAADSRTKWAGRAADVTPGQIANSSSRWGMIGAMS